MCIRDRQRCGAGAATATVEDDVVDADPQRRVDVVLHVLGRQLHADWDATRFFADMVSEAREVVDGFPVGKARRRYRRRSLLETTDLGNPPDDLVAGTGGHLPGHK